MPAIQSRFLTARRSKVRGNESISDLLKLMSHSYRRTFESEQIRAVGKDDAALLFRHVVEVESEDAADCRDKADSLNEKGQRVSCLLRNSLLRASAPLPPSDNQAKEGRQAHSGECDYQEGSLWGDVANGCPVQVRNECVTDAKRDSGKHRASKEKSGE